MAFPINLTNAIDGVTEIIAAHLNNLEAKVGIDNSTVPTSLDYLLKSPSSIDPGHKHSKLWASDGSTQAVTVDAAGNVGFGTEMPVAKVHANSSVNGMGGSIYSNNPNTGTGAFAYIGLGGSGPNGYLDIYQLGGSYTTSGQYVQNSGLIQSRSAAGLGISAVDAAGTIRFYTAGSSERMRLDNGGNVGIGTPSPGYKLDVDGSIGSLASGARYAFGSDVGDEIQFNIGGAFGTTGNVHAFRIASALNAQVNGEVHEARITGSIVGAASGTNPNMSSLRIDAPSYTNNGATVTNAYSLWINAAPSFATNNYALYVENGTSYFGGNVGIGTTSPGKKLDVNGYVRGVGLFNTLNSAPADGDLATGECALWFDKTDGAAKLMIKAKQNDGTVKTGSVSLN